MVLLFSISSLLMADIFISELMKRKRVLSNRFSWNMVWHPINESISINLQFSLAVMDVICSILGVCGTSDHIFPRLK